MSLIHRRLGTGLVAKGYGFLRRILRWAEVIFGGSPIDVERSGDSIITRELLSESEIDLEKLGASAITRELLGESAIMRELLGESALGLEQV